MDFKHKIKQWNCRGLKPNYNEVSLLISEYNPSVFCFQDAFLKPDDNISLKGFNIYNYIQTDPTKKDWFTNITTSNCYFCHSWLRNNFMFSFISFRRNIHYLLPRLLNFWKPDTLPRITNCYDVHDFMPQHQYLAFFCVHHSCLYFFVLYLKA